MGYNTGGYLPVAQALGRFIVGNSRQGQPFIDLHFNNKASQFDRKYNFQSTSYPLDLQRVVFITSRITAYTSEVVINGLRPYTDIEIIGDTTNGRPLGVSGWTIGKSYYVWPVTFRLVNSLGDGDYFEGIVPDFQAIDDITRDFSDPLETCLKEAMSYLRTGAGTKSIILFKKTPRMSESPELVREAITVINAPGN